MIKSLIHYFDLGVGKAEDFSMENRVFNGICLFSFILCVIFIPANYYLGIYSQTILMAFLLIPLTAVYYFSRFKRQFTLSVSLLIIVFLGALIANYFVNAGASGTTLLYFFMASHIISAVTGVKYGKYWFVLSLIIGIGLLCIEYFRPGLIFNNYSSRTEEFVDVSLAFVISMTVIYVTMKFILSNYQKERILSQKRAHEMADQKKALEFLNSEKDKLFSIVSHDFRGPLATLHNSLELLTEEDLTKEEEEEIKSEMLTQLRYTSSMLDNVLTWSRSQIKNIEPQFKGLNVHNEVHKVIMSVSGLTAYKEISVDNAVDENLLVFSDQEMLQVILRNLINNAIKFTPPQGRITIDATIKDNNIIISVEDNGIGMSSDQVSRLFTFNVSSTYGTNREKGMGLGLYIVQDLLEKLDGNIQVKSAKDLGTTFYITLKGVGK